MNLEDEVAEAQSCIADPPKNESNTCDWIILPLLWSAGYARRDIESRMADNTGQFPDYTLLPNAVSVTWYLEAKAWSIALEDTHVKQALNYANHNGKRFVALTNGQVWRLYDNTIQGVLADKLVTEAFLRDTTQITDFLITLSKTEVLSGSLERLAAEADERKKQETLEQYERQQREEEAQRIYIRQMELRALLHATLPEQLKSSDSELILNITACLNEQKQFNGLTPKTLSLWFSKLFSQPHGIREEEAIVSTPPQTPSFPQHSGERTLTLKALQGIPIDGKSSRPVALQTPDGAQTVVRSWVDFAEQAVRWLLQQSRPLPVPFETRQRTRWFLNHAPVHRREEIRKKFKAITADGKTVYMDADRSGEMFLQDIYALCQAMQIEPEQFRVTVEG